MGRSVADVGGELLCVSQFTLYGDTRKGNRPSFTEAAPPEEAEALYEQVREALGAQGGRFGARMAVSPGERRSGDAARGGLSRSRQDPRRPAVAALAARVRQRLYWFG